MSAKKLMVSGAVVLLHTPRSEFTVTYGATMLGAKAPPQKKTTNRRLVWILTGFSPPCHIGNLDFAHRSYQNPKLAVKKGKGWRGVGIRPRKA
jgi:hypothetical protein